MTELINQVIDTPANHWYVLSIGIITGTIIPFIYLGRVITQNKQFKQKLGI